MTGRIEHHATRLGAVGAVAVISALLWALAGVIVGIQSTLVQKRTSGGPRASGVAPTALWFAVGSLLLLGGIIQLSVPPMASHPASGWAAGQVLATVGLFVVVIFTLVGRGIWQAHLANRNGKAEPR
jgi:hypothetical protein